MTAVATVAVTAPPCWSSSKSTATAGLRRIVYGEFYRDTRIFDVAKQLGIELLHLPFVQEPASPAT